MCPQTAPATSTRRFRCWPSSRTKTSTRRFRRSPVCWCWPVPVPCWSCSPRCTTTSCSWPRPIGRYLRNRLATRTGTVGVRFWRFLLGVVCVPCWRLHVRCRIWCIFWPLVICWQRSWGRSTCCIFHSGRSTWSSRVSNDLRTDF